MLVALLVLVLLEAEPVAEPVLLAALVPVTLLVLVGAGMLRAAVSTGEVTGRLAGAWPLRTVK